MPDFVDLLTFVFGIAVIAAMIILIRKLFKNRDKF
jgi:hypothetical protein